MNFDAILTGTGWNGKIQKYNKYDSGMKKIVYYYHY